MRKCLALVVFVVMAGVAPGGAGAVTEGTTFGCQFYAKYPGPAGGPLGAKTICPSTTYTFLRTETICTDGVMYEYPVFARADRTFFYAGNATAGDPDYSGGTETPVYRQVKPNAKLLAVVDGFAGEFHDYDARRPTGASC